MDGTDYSVSPVLPESQVPQPEYSADKNPSGTRHVTKHGFFRTWFATSTDIRPTSDSADVKWDIHWYTPVSIIVLLLMSTATAVAHHCFYNRMDATLVGNDNRQRWNMWIGSGLSFNTKVMLTAALGISRTQWVWLTLRTKCFTLEGIDTLFGVVSDPGLFLQWKVLKHANVTTIMAIEMWIFPLSAILRLGIITGRIFLLINIVPCSVRLLMFRFDGNSTAKIPGPNEMPEGLKVLNLGDWDIARSDSEKPTIRAQARISRAMKLPAYTSMVTNLPNLLSVNSRSLTTLDAMCGANCTYTVEFFGPTTTCAEFTAGNPTSWTSAARYLGTTRYRAVEQPKARGSFLVGLRHDDPRLSPVSLMCRSATARYTVQHVVEERRFLESNITKVEAILLPSFQLDPAFPDRTYPTIHYTKMYFFSWRERRPFGSASATTTLLEDIYTNPSAVGPAIEKMAHMKIISMLAFNLNIKGNPHILDITAVQHTTCTTTKYVPLYVYPAKTLLFIYVLAVLCALTTSVASFITLVRNGMASSKIFLPSSARPETAHPMSVLWVEIALTSAESEKVEPQFGVLRAGPTEHDSCRR